jgi:hypothetical protein
MNLNQRWDAERALYAAVGNAPDLASLAGLATTTAQHLHGAACQRFRDAVQERYAHLVGRTPPRGAP